jgi:hypothetical protein
MLYVGLDVHRRRTQVSVMDEDGHELFNRNVPNDRERLAEVLLRSGAGNAGGVRIGLWLGVVGRAA